MTKQTFAPQSVFKEIRTLEGNVYKALETEIHRLIDDIVGCYPEIHNSEQVGPSAHARLVKIFEAVSND